MKYSLVLFFLFCCSMRAMEIDDTDDIEMKVESGTKIGSASKQVSWHEDLKDSKEPTPIGSVPKVPSKNTQDARHDRAALDNPKTIRISKISKEEQTLDKCCPSCWANGMKENCICGCPQGFLEEAIRFFCCDCFYNCFLKKKYEIPEGKQEE